MKKQNNSYYSNSHQTLGSFIFKFHHGAVIILLVYLIGFLPIHSFAQPLEEGKDKFLGCGTSCYIYRHLDRYWNQVTAGNEGKWGSVETVQGQYNWTDLDVIYDYAVNRSLPFKEHTLVCGEQQPWWIASLDSAGQRAAVKNWIRLVGERYPEMSFVDVVNEPFHAPPSYAQALGGDGLTGWDWVITAFELARQYCPPNAKLILNEYNILHDNSQTTKYINLITLLKNRDLIDGIGVQGHYFEFRSHVDATSNVYVYNINTIKSNLDRLAATEIPIYISEFDIDEKDDENQLEQYKIYFPIFWSHPAVKGITLWGYIEGDCWSAHPNTYVLLSDGTERPALQWMCMYIVSPLPPVPVSPNFARVQRDPFLIWHSSDSAISYNVQVATNSGFTNILVDTTVSDTLLHLSPLAANSRFYWHVSAANEYGSSEYSVPASFMTGDQTTAVNELGEKPRDFNLFQNYPNPFNSNTIIEFKLLRMEHTILDIFALNGQHVKNLISEFMPAGLHQLKFYAKELPSGVYIYRLKIGNIKLSRKLIIMK
jgi:endo-1,4-beta-xylanase